MLPVSNTMEAIKKISRIFSAGDKDPSCSAVILAAGSSVRMGNDKL